jgi:TM2 domain-containing membrane protein YozV
VGWLLKRVLVLAAPHHLSGASIRSGVGGRDSALEELSGFQRARWPQGWSGLVRRIELMMKNAGLAAVLSFFIPGLGQIYNGQITKGLLIVVVQTINVALTNVLIGFVFYPIVLVYAVFDAYRTAQRINAYGGKVR